MTRRPITASIATIPGREAWLADVCRSLRPQVDTLLVTLNRWTGPLPACLGELGCVVRLGEGPAWEKFRPWTRPVAARGGRGYLLTCDDDILYPPKYAQRMVGTLDAWAGKVIATAHGAALSGDARSTDDATDTSSFTRESGGKWLSIIGTGVMAVDLDAMPPLDLAELAVPNADDTTLAVWAQRRAVPVRDVHRRRWWLRDMGEPGHPGLWTEGGRERNAAVIAAYSDEAAAHGGWRTNALPLRALVAPEPLADDTPTCRACGR